MKKENNNTNIKNQEEKVMNKMNENMDADVKIELEECKRYNPGVYVSASYSQ